MKRIIIIVLALMAGISAKAQESNILIGTGLFGETGDHAQDTFPGLVLRLSYGLDVSISDQWSVMPGVGIRTQMAKVNEIGWDGGDPDGMSMADVFFQARYHFVSGRSRVVLGLGPQFSYMVQPDKYYIDADPFDPRGGKEKFKKWDISLQPSLVLQGGRHWQWGFEASVGLRNMMRPYPEYNVSGSVHLHYLALFFGWRF